MVQIEVKKKTRMYGASAVLLAIVLVSMVYVIGSSPLIFPSGSPAVGGMKSFSSNQELVNYLNSGTNGQYTGYYGGDLDTQFFGARPVTSLAWRQQRKVQPAPLAQPAPQERQRALKVQTH